MRRRSRQLSATVLATVVGACMATASVPSPGAVASESPQIGFEARAEASPVAVWLFEPTVPAYSSPQAELDLGYSRVTAATGPNGRALASMAWPGPLVGDGFGLVSEGLGLPRTEWPLAANASYPGGDDVSSEPVPGVRQRATTAADLMSASVAVEPVPKGETEEAPGALDALVEYRSADSASRVDLAGVPSTAASSRAKRVVLLGGLVTARGLTGEVTASTDGTRARVTNRTTITGLEVDGTPVEVSDQGVEVAGDTTSPPGQPDAAQALLDQLGVRVTAVAAEKSTEGPAGRATVTALKVVIDSAVLRRQLDLLPLGDVVGGIPDAAADLKVALQTVLGLTSRIEILVGYAETQLAGAAGLGPGESVTGPGTGDPDEEEPPVPSGSEGTSTGGTLGNGGVGSLPEPGGLPAPGGSDGGADDIADLPYAEAVADAGLPDLYSLPSLLLILALALATAMGLWMQVIGRRALGTVAPCAHGFRSGIPNIRKARITR